MTHTTHNNTVGFNKLGLTAGAVVYAVYDEGNGAMYVAFADSEFAKKMTENQGETFYGGVWQLLQPHTVSPVIGLDTLQCLTPELAKKFAAERYVDADDLLGIIDDHHGEYVLVYDHEEDEAA